MCNKTYSCSVVEAKTFRSIMTAVHEIGHSLGMEHDGKKHNFKCPSSGYIMSHAGGDVGKIAWSPCSKNNLKAFLATAPNVLSNQVACLNNQPEVGNMYLGAGNYQELHLRNIRYSTGVRGNRHGKTLKALESLPGAKFSVMEQCRMGGDGSWKPSKRRYHLRVRIFIRNFF